MIRFSHFPAVNIGLPLKCVTSLAYQQTVICIVYKFSCMQMFKVHIYFKGLRKYPNLNHILPHNHNDVAKFPTFDMISKQLDSKLYDCTSSYFIKRFHSCAQRGNVGSGPQSPPSTSKLSLQTCVI